MFIIDIAEDAYANVNELIHEECTSPVCFREGQNITSVLFYIKIFIIDILTYLFIATFILENMNKDVEPCENFYQFACGNFMSKENVSNDIDMTSTKIIETQLQTQFSDDMKSEIKVNDLEAYNKMKQHYRNCMN